MTKQRRAALYVRVSTHGQTTENQRAELEVAVQQRGWALAGVYDDTGISGSKGRDQRPSLDRLMKDAVRGKFDAVLVWDASRMARSTAHLATIMGELQALGIVQVFMKEAIDTSTPHGRAMVQMAGVFSELEREMIRERVRAGLARARRQCKRLGRPPVPPAVIARVRDASREGLSIRAIAARTGVSVGSVHRALRGSGT